VRPASGRVSWRGADVTGWPADRVARQGLKRTFQSSVMFPSATVRGNLELARSCAGRRVTRDAEVALPATVDDLSRFCRLDELAGTPARALSTGQLRMLGIGMALLSRPKVLLLDEPSLGLAPILLETSPTLLPGRTRAWGWPSS
jgi:ABC-type branched-subunit amino acid transport system ATPase component